MVEKIIRVIGERVMIIDCCTGNLDCSAAFFRQRPKSLIEGGRLSTSSLMITTLSRMVCLPSRSVL